MDADFVRSYDAACTITLAEAAILIKQNCNLLGSGSAVSHAFSRQPD